MVVSETTIRHKPAAHVIQRDRVQHLLDYIKPLLDHACPGTSQKRRALRLLLLRQVNAWGRERQPHASGVVRRQQLCHSATCRGQASIAQHELSRLRGRTQHYTAPAVEDGCMHDPGSIRPIQGQDREYGLTGPVVAEHTIDRSLLWCHPLGAKGHSQDCPQFLHKFQALDTEIIHR